jgi:CPA1 family monovalent cation:H+ antiporter
MRGIVTVAAALALPGGTSSGGFPFRDLIIFSAFGVVLSTLVVQGMTLGPLLERLGLGDDGEVDREVRHARVAVSRAALRVLEEDANRTAADILRPEYEARIRSGEGASVGRAEARDESALAALQSRAVEAQRRKLIELRAAGVIGDDAFHAAEEEIDLLDLTADARIRPDRSSL